MNELELRAWEIYCRETAGSMDARDFWWELPPYVQGLFLSKAENGVEVHS